MIELSKIKENIAEAIRLSGLTQKEIGEKIGVSQQTVSHYVRGDKLPALDTFAALCRVLDVDPADLLY